MMEKSLSPVEKWQANFEQQPSEALDRLLMGRAYMGWLNRNDTDEILYRLFHTATKDYLIALDKAMQSWFIRYWESVPSSISASQWDEILQNAFSTVIRLNLRETQAWLLENYSRARVWLRSLYLCPAGDPEADMLRTIALCQHNQDLLPLWMRLCRLEEDRPLHFASIGLLGLRKLPDENGELPGGLHPVVFSGIVNLANAIDRQVRPEKEGKEFWFLEVRAIMARYPRSSQYWTEHFLPFVSSEPDSTAAKWLGKLIPKLKAVLEGHQQWPKATQFLRPVSLEENKAMIALLKEKPLEEIRERLTAFLAKHRDYARQTGDVGYLVKTLNNVSLKILRQDPDWALDLIEEAFSWAPYDPIVWVERAQIESYCGRQARALGLLWEAKHKFPEVPHIRTNLAEMLRKYDKDDIAEVVYRQAVEDFPKHEYCRTGLAEVLKAQGKLAEAEDVYRKTKMDFPDDVVCRTGLAEVLKAQGKLAEAEDVYRQAVEDFPDNVFCHTGLAEVLKAQGKLAEAEDVYRKTKMDFPDDVVCRTGLAEVLKAQGKLAEAEDVYRQAVEDFPDNVFCHTGLAVVWLLQGKEKDSICLLKETVKQFPEDPVAKDFLQKIKKEAPDEVTAVEYDKLTAAKAEVKRTRLREIDSMEPAMVPSQVMQIQDEEVVRLREPEVDLRQKEKGERTEIVVSSGVPTFREEVPEDQIGLANLYRLAARLAEGEEKVRYYQESVTACEKALTLKALTMFLPCLRRDLGCWIRK